MLSDSAGEGRVYIADGRFNGIHLLRLPTHNAAGQTIGSELFCFIEFTYSGTGYMHDDQLYHLKRDGTISRVDWTPARNKGACEGLKLEPGQGVWKGESHFTRADDQGLNEMCFVYYVWNKGDGNCCPTGGTVRGAYRVQAPAKKGEPYKLVVDRWDLSPEVPR
jgi:hypothetical protein